MLVVERDLPSPNGAEGGRRYSITSSAIASTPDGIASPSVAPIQTAVMLVGKTINATTTPATIPGIGTTVRSTGGKGIRSRFGFSLMRRFYHDQKANRTEGGFERSTKPFGKMLPKVDIEFDGAPERRSLI